MKSEIDFNTILTIATNVGYIIAGVVISYFIVRKKLNEYFNDIKNNLNVGSKIPKQSKTDMEIIKRMEQVKEILNADRVLVYEFHNGEHYANGRSALKFSCTYEVYRTGIESVQSKLSSIPISCVPQFISKLLEEEFIKETDVEHIRDKMPATYGLSKDINITSYQNLVIRNGKEEPVGFLAVHWCNGQQMTYNDRELYRLGAFIEEHIITENDKKK